MFREHKDKGELLSYFVAKSYLCSSFQYMTEGILLREMLADPLLTQYGVIIIDEAHERNVLTDTLLGLLKKVIKKRDTIKVIISSATIDAELFYDFFNNKTKSGKDAAVILSVEGRMYPVEVFYLKESCPCYVKETVETCMKIHDKEPQGDILAFLTGQDEVLQGIDLLREHQSRRNKDDLLILPMYGTLPNSDQLKVFFGAPKGIRKIILATNIAETSITIPGIAYGKICLNISMKIK